MNVILKHKKDLKNYKAKLEIKEIAYKDYQEMKQNGRSIIEEPKM